MIFAVAYRDLSPSRLPWVTWGVLACWLVAAVVVPDAATERLGLTPQSPTATGFALHWLLHASGAHLLASVMLLLCVGCVLEEDWGHAFFAGFLIVAVGLSSGVYLGVAHASPRPLVGACGAVAAAIAAFAVRHFSEGVRYTLLGWWQKPIHGEQWVPVWAIAPLWFLGEVAMQLGGSGAGPTRGTGYAAQLAGAALGVVAVLAMRRYDVERRLLGRMPAGGPHPALAAAFEARTQDGPHAALVLLETAVRERPEDPGLVVSLCDIASEAGEPQRAARPLELCLRALLRRGEADEAAKLWRQAASQIARPALDARASVLLGEALRRQQAGLEAARVLRAALEARDMTPGLALRVVDLARDLHAQVALRALRRALEAPALDATKRTRLEALAVQLERRAALDDVPDLDVVAAPPPDRHDRTIEIEPDEDLRAPPPGLPRVALAEAPSARVRGLAADGALVESEDDPEELSQPDALLEPLAPPLPETQPILARPAPASPRDPRASRARVLPPPPTPVADALPDPGPAAPEPPGVPEVQTAGAGTAAIAAAGVEAALGARFSSAKRIEAVPIAWQEGRLQLRQGDTAPGWLDLRRVDAVAAAGVRGLSAKPVIVVDLLLNWSSLDDESLRVIRMRSDRFDPARLLPGGATGLEAFRGWLAALLAASGATPLPDSHAAHGRPFALFDDLESYEREVLRIAS